jgi:hypothetical protein
MIELPHHHRQSIRGALATGRAGLHTAAALARKAGLPAGDVQAMLRGPTSFSVGYYRQMLDAAERCLGLVIPTPSPLPPQDALQELVKIGRIKNREAEAGRALRSTAEGWLYPGLHPCMDLLQQWPARLREMWTALRTADRESRSICPPLPTCSSTCWNIAVANEPPAVLGRFPNGYMSRLEITSLRMGLRAVADLLESIPICDRVEAPPPAPPAPPAEAVELGISVDMRRVDVLMIRSVVPLLGSRPIHKIAAELGCPHGLVKKLSSLQSGRPDLLLRVAAGELTVHNAQQVAGTVKFKSRVKPGARIGKAPIWPPLSAQSWKVFNSVKARDPELARRVEKGELSVYAAGLMSGYLKPTPKQSKATVSFRRSAAEIESRA